MYIATIYYDVAYDFLFHLINSVTMETNQEYNYNFINHIYALKKVIHSNKAIM